MGALRMPKSVTASQVPQSAGPETALIGNKGAIAVTPFAP